MSNAQKKDRIAKTKCCCGRMKKQYRRVIGWSGKERDSLSPSKNQEKNKVALRDSFEGWSKRKTVLQLVQGREIG